ncbi:MAG: leucyl aminopeptidase [Ancalomicrobiaceae bacterium]|nr:leucyl aminopeptidase [Ancalomicrobiaceae bacterium]
MPQLTLTFAKPIAPKHGVAVVLVADAATLGREAATLDAEVGGAITRGFAKATFTGKLGSTLDIVAPGQSDLDRILAVGIGKVGDLKSTDWIRIGGVIEGKLAEFKAEAATVLAELADGAELSPGDTADLALGIELRGYTFDRYKTKKKDEDRAPKERKVTIAGEGQAGAKKAYAARAAVAGGVNLARDLVIEPGNVLSPAEFADRAEKLEKLGVEVEIMGEKELKKLGFGALLGVSQGSARPPRVVIFKWNGAKSKDAQPVAFIGKGVVFDSGGISIKPAAGMEDMKGDMAGAAAVTGLFHALAKRKAKVNAIGAIGLVENMPDGNAQRPGDIVTSLSGQTIEIINTDAEGRLVLADVVWHVQETYKPKWIIDLATLTGAILVALGKTYAGLFSSSDELAERLAKAGEATGELVWRMPMGADYDKLIDSSFADMKNTGGRHGGSITAAHFIKRFTNDVPWAHLDIAGTGMDSTQTDTNKLWASGWGVRLLDRLVADYYEE